MNPDTKIQNLWTAARSMSATDRVPYAFEHRVMARLQESGHLEHDVGTATGFGRAAMVSVAVAMLVLGLDLSVEDPVRDKDVEEALEFAVLPVDDGGIEL